MTGYLLSVMGTVLVCSLLTAIAPEGKTSAVIKGVARLACVLTIIAPVLRFFKTGEFEENTKENLAESVIETDASFIQYYSEERVRETEAALKKEIEKQYGEITSLRIEWSLEKESFGGLYGVENIRVERICVKVPEGTAKEVEREMCSYLTKNYCSEVLIE